jgi:hypothetical protein
VIWSKIPVFWEFPEVEFETFVKRYDAELGGRKNLSITSSLL